MLNEAPANMNATPPHQFSIDPAMMLSQGEKNRALQIKTAVEEDNQLQNLTDFDYVQYALACRGESLEQIRERVYLQQAFKQEYNLTDDADQGIQIYQQFLVQQPYFMLVIEYLPSTLNYISICDLAELFPSRIQTQEQYRVVLGGFFYKYQCMNTDFQAIRTGISSLVECKDASFDNLSSAFLDKLGAELLRHYPYNTKEVMFVNSATVANMIYGLFKRILPARLTEKFQLGHTVDGMEMGGQRIDGLYKTPTPELAQQRMLGKVLQYLTKRYHHRDTFSLANATVVDAAFIA